MQPEIVVGLLSLCGTLVGSLGGIMAANKLVIYRIGELEKKVEKHNNVIERVFKLEDNDVLLEEKIKVLNNRLDHIEV